ncbi:MAG: hypothetical protein [Hatfieldvirus porci]|uniref:Uncharacterized protein n=1 Tax=phage Lak_Megaphage_RVC_JS4_GC31 TaxID=3109228 RepID=A0ABZ0Z3G7_9CAUD|nr:MAG: hypothetical protein [phage Lak_Megaphage_RVC_AP3_GC31]WQJ53216.1 MAG: hypothetical protein [phage Lak_Megaphage_RVC_JS4_GC31]
MINDNIINFVTDVYESFNDNYNINNYKDNEYFMNIHSENLYEYFEYIKYYIIETFVKGNKITDKTVFNFKITNEIINFFIPNIDILRTTVLFNFDDDVVKDVWHKICKLTENKECESI